MAEQTQKKPNILVIWGDDIGQSNLSGYTNWKIVFMEQRATGTMRIWTDCDSSGGGGSQCFIEQSSAGTEQ
jgi:hypothetical protein